MINMKKHSNAHNVLVKFERHNKMVQIHYTDDGVGLPENYQYGNGLTNTETRIKMLGGQLIFDKTATRGLKILVSFPTA